VESPAHPSADAHSHRMAHVRYILSATFPGICKTSGKPESA
jgi:hypothetical protein